MNWKGRVKHLLAERNMTQTDLGNMLGVTKATVSLWLSDTVSFTDRNITKIQFKIADALNVSKDYIEFGDSSKKAIGRSVPLLEHKDIAEWCLEKTVDNDEATYVYCPQECSPSTYATYVNNSAMESTSHSEENIPHGSIVYVDPEIELKERSICVFKNRGIIIGRCESVDNSCTVVFHNTRYPAIELKVVLQFGTVIGMFNSLITTVQN